MKKKVVVIAFVLMAQMSSFMSAEKPYRYLALGDSYTIGQGVSTSDRWPFQLVHFLKEKGIIFEDPQIIAKTGWTTEELSDGIDKADPNGPYDLVSLLIGVNNQFRGMDSDSYREEFTRLLERAAHLANENPSHVLVLSIPDWGVTPFAAGQNRQNIAASIDRFNRINQEESKKAGALYVDITSISRQAANNPALITGDGLHPSGQMYAQWALEALPAVLKITAKS